MQPSTSSDPIRSQATRARRQLWLIRFTVGICVWVGSVHYGHIRQAHSLEPEAGSPADTREAAISSARRLLTLTPEPNARLGIGRERIEVARELSRHGEHALALDLLIQALEDHSDAGDPSESRTLLSIRLAIASSAWQVGDHDQVIRQTELVLEAFPDELELTRSVAARQLLIRSLVRASRLEDALVCLTRWSQLPAPIDELVAEQALLVGGAALRAQQADVAKQAYEMYSRVLPRGDRLGDAKLGAAWAAASGAESSELAEARLAEFLDGFPRHPDVPHALAARARLLEQLGDMAAAETLRLELLREHSRSQAAASVLHDVASQQAVPWPETIREAWTRRLEAVTQRESLAIPAIAPRLWPRLFEAAFRSTDDRLWQAAVEALLVMDRDGEQSWATLERLENGQTAIAEHLAVDLLARLAEPLPHSTNDSPPTIDQGPKVGDLPKGHEAACRWAGARERWSLLALVAEQVEPPSDQDARPRGLVIDRLLAESLMQTLRGDEATRWWEAIVRVWGCRDFETTLRAAETAIAYGSVESAKEHLEIAFVAAEGAFQQSLVRVLKAELAIRDARLEEAREGLERIARGPETPAELRPRAQWMIGETYFLQDRFAEAIDAYRRVEGLDDHGHWVPAALLQSGKAFERLGRHREAATCYTALLTRFQDSPHAAPARSRLALVGSEAGRRR